MPMPTPNTNPETFTITEHMTVTFVLDWGVIHVSVLTPEHEDDWGNIIIAAENVLAEHLSSDVAMYVLANEVYLTNSHGETVET